MENNSTIDKLAIKNCPYCYSKVFSPFCDKCGNYLFDFTFKGLTKWGFCDIFKVIIFSLIFFFISFLIYIFYISFQKEFQLINSISFFINLFIVIIIFSFYIPILFLTFYYIKKKGSYIDFIGLKNINLKYILLGIGLGFTIIGISLAYFLILDFFGMKIYEEFLSAKEEIEIRIKEEINLKEIFLNVFPLLFFLIAIIAPFIEEIYFRGFCYLVFRKKFKISIAIILSSIYFAILHFSLLNFIPILLASILITYAYEKTFSLPLVMIGHGINNLTAVLFLYFFF